MMPKVNQEHVTFVLGQAKDGLSSLVSRLEMNKEKTHLETDIQESLIVAFKQQFPSAELGELDRIIEWIILTSFHKLKENKNDRT